MIPADLQPPPSDDSVHPRLLELPKMSTTLMELIQPLLRPDGDESAEEMRFLLRLGSIAWNALEEGAPQPAVVRERLRQELGDAGGAPLGALLDTLFERRRELFSDDPRSVGRPEVIEEDGWPVSVNVPVVATPRLRAYLDGPTPPDRLAGHAPTFAEFVRTHRVDPRFLALGIPSPFPPPQDLERRRLHLGWLGEEVDWLAPPLTDLMRGDATPPPNDGSNVFTRRYLPILMEVEHAVLRLADAQLRVPTDRETREAYRALRRHPDGTGGGPVAHVVWQALALSLARRPYSAREVEAVLRRLERSVRLHERWPGGTAYVTFLRTALSVG